MDKYIKYRVNFYLGTLTTTNLDDLVTMNISQLKESSREIPLKKLLEKNNLTNRRFCALLEDNEKIRSPACLVKNRINNDSVILRCINIKRHWYHYYHKPLDIPFNKKKDNVFWRGTTTGQPDRPGNRFKLVKRWFHHPIMNIGFSSICQNKDEYKDYIKDNANIEDFLKYKYILSVEGNDKDSGIQWKLNSNSLVMMAKPRVTSWLMETTLIPNYHYILLKDDFSDLVEKVLMCNANPKKCKEIIKNANHFMKQFSSEYTEQFIENEVIKEYFKRVI
jgi:hypothetical protein